MIQAIFRTSSAIDVPCVVPDDEMIEIAGMVGYTMDDLFSVEIPAGASRYSRVRAIVRGTDINRLYTSNAFAPATCEFRWTENGDGNLTNAMYVSLLPPRPLFENTGTITANKLFIVEGVDERYWWQRAQTPSVSQDTLYTQFFSPDGRWQVGQYTGTVTLPIFLDSLRNLLPVGTFNMAAYVPHASLLNRLADVNFTPECSLGLAIDIVLSQTGYILVWRNTAGLEVVKIQNDSATIASWMNETQRACAGGLEPSSTTATANADVLISGWMGTDAQQINRMPRNVAMSFPVRAPEGLTWYGNASQAQISGPYLRVDHNLYREIPFVSTGSQAFTIPTQRNRLDGPWLTLKEPRSLTVTDNSTLNSDNIVATARQAGSMGVGWDYPTYITQCRELLALRCSMNIGRVAWAGWSQFPSGAFRGTMLRYSLGKRGGDLVAFATTECDDSDWIFGPSGVQATDPRDVVVSKGMVHARRVGSGMMQIDVPPPNVRVFPAKITTAQRLGTTGNAYWQWVYGFEEIEPNPLQYTPLTKAVTPRARKSGAGFLARNLTEAGNVFSGPIHPNNRIAPSVLQSDYLCQAIVEALPIGTDTVVMMCEHFPTLYEDDTNIGPWNRDYWFAMPNSVKTTCYTCLTCDGNYGLFTSPSTICDTDFGFFDAPENNADYGVF
jgi:hypothetical protein